MHAVGGGGGEGEGGDVRHHALRVAAAIPPAVQVDRPKRDPHDPRWTSTIVAPSMPPSSPASRGRRPRRRRRRRRRGGGRRRAVGRRSGRRRRREAAGRVAFLRSEATARRSCYTPRSSGASNSTAASPASRPTKPARRARPLRRAAPPTPPSPLRAPRAASRAGGSAASRGGGDGGGGGGDGVVPSAAISICTCVGVRTVLHTLRSFTATSVAKAGCVQGECPTLAPSVSPRRPPARRSRRVRR